MHFLRHLSTFINVKIILKMPMLILVHSALTDATLTKINKCCRNIDHC